MVNTVIPSKINEHISENNDTKKTCIIKNLIKECFSNNYLKSSTQGVPGGTLSVKTINYLKQSHLI